MSPSWGFFIISILSILTVNNLVDGVAVMSVDFGSEWMKVAIVSPGVPMEIALNKESKRKTPAFIAFRDNERTFGEDAQNIAVRFPANGYGYLLDLLGKKIDNPIVQLYQKNFPYYKIVEDPERGTIVFQHDSDTSFTPEELIGMLLHKAKEFAEESAGQIINDAVLVVPGFFNQAERKAFVNAANLAGLKVLQLINDYTAVALNYGIFRRKDFNESTQYIMFYDMGASSTSATLVAYQLVKQKDRGIVETNPQASVIGIGYDRTLGGLEMQLRLQKHLASKFNEVKKTKNNVFDNPRAMAKLFKEAGRVKNVLSANVEHYAQVEGLLDDEDFKVLVTREQFETLCKDLFDRIKNPIDQALKTAGLSLEVVSQFILVGANTRVPKVQETLSSIVNMELSKNINTDEAAVMGAVYKAADISTGFKVKKFITKDAVLFPVQVTFQRANDGSEEVKHVKRTLFGVMNPFPQKKIITFNKHVDDFSFNVHYGELDHIPPHELEALGSLNLSRVDLKGVKEALVKHEGKNIESKGIKAHFVMSDSGILSLLNVDYVAEKIVGDEDEEQSTLQKIGSSFTKLFGGSEPEPEPVPQPEPSVPTEEKPAETSQEQKEEANNINKEKPEHDNKENVGKPETNETDKVANQTDKEPAKNGTEKIEKKPKVIVIKENITSSHEEFGVPSLTDAQFQNAAKKIEKFDEYDRKKQKKEKARNALESYVFDAQNKLELEEYIGAATNEEKQSILKACSEISEWLDDEGFDAESDIYEDKLTQVKTLTGPLYRRVKEHEERPEALAALKAMINGSTHFLNTIVTTTKEALAKDGEAIFTQIEIDTLEKVIKETEEWKKNMEEEQAKLPLSEPPKLTIKLITEKMAALDREVKYLVNKAKFWKPKKAPKKSSNETKENSENKTKVEENLEDIKPVVEEEEPVENKNETESILSEPENVIESTETETPKESVAEENVETNQESEDSSHQEL